ncbi:UNVERIFIED_CONTAM: hypothetical protein GTU68_019215 [Idotea baltica]|nr:hypothetical protein [Idotea baltica]
MIWVGLMLATMAVKSIRQKSTDLQHRARDLIGFMRKRFAHRHAAL